MGCISAKLPQVPEVTANLNIYGTGLELELWDMYLVYRVKDCLTTTTKAVKKLRIVIVFGAENNENSKFFHCFRRRKQ